MASNAKAVRPKGRGGLVKTSYKRLRKLIVEGHLVPGSRLVETELAEELGVSRGTVRRALEQLHHEGHLTQTKPGRQSRLVVAPMTAADAKELYYLIAQIEGLAVSELANMPDEVREAVANELEVIESKITDSGDQRASDPNRFVALDRTFHWTFVNAGGGARTKSLHKILRPQLERYARLYTGQVGETVAKARREHQALIEQVRAGDSEGAERAVLNNWHNGAERVARLIRAAEAAEEGQQRS